MISENNLSICAILESHVADSNLLKLCPYVFRHWNWTSNGSCCSKGSRIILGWNHNDVDIVIINQDDQSIHTRVWLKLERKELFCTFIYAHNKYTQRRGLWNNLRLHKHYVRDRPWCMLGDFNAALFLHDYSAGHSNVDISMREFKECVEDIEVMDVQHSGLQFTWSQKPKGIDGVLKKIDRVMANLMFTDTFAGSYAIFKPYRISDHAPSVLCIPTVLKPKPKPFKFYNLITSNENFRRVVMEGWSTYISGFHKYRVTKKLKLLKKPLRKLLYEKGNLHNNVNQLRNDLDQVQTRLDLDPFNAAIRDEEALVLAAFNEACLMEEKFLKQKSKIDWLREGDSNSAYFHKAVKSHISRCHIDVVTNSDGEIFQNDKVADAFVNHYEIFLGPDGYTAAFFKESWDIIADDFFAAVCEFFTNGKLLRELNHTIISLVPKVGSPSRINDYRPISCCNVMFKCISKIIANRIKESLKVLISPNQSVFVPGPDGYTAAFFKESWDIIADDFVAAVCEFFTNGKLLRKLNHTIIALVPKVSSPSRINDYRPISCCNVMFKCISKIIANRIKESLKVLISPNQSAFVPCRSIADNILLTQELMHNYHLDRGVPRCAFKVDIQKAYDTVDWGFLNNVLAGFGFHARMIGWIMECVTTTSFYEGCLPVKYLGVPLVTSRLVFRDCKELIEKVQDRVNDWKNKFLSAAGWLQLVRSVLSSMHVYWASMFILPSRVLADIEQIIRGFLWCHGPMSRGRAKVAWEVVCLPKDEGGLGVRRLDLFNKALMTSHIWKLLSHKESLWVKWVHMYKLQERNFWDIPIRGPLADFISPRDRYSAGLNTSSNLQGMHFLSTNINSDRLEWRDEIGVIKPFSVSTVWSTIRPRDFKVAWYAVIWFPYCIPRHAFNLWLVVKQRLKMQDKVASWEVSDSLMSVWRNMKLLAGLPNSSDVFNQILMKVITFSKKKSPKSVIAKLVLAASAYFLWQERNWRLFKKNKRTSKQESYGMSYDIEAVQAIA
nr:hypothetical protein [Tanacetum cinerariifolium]